MNGKFRFGVKFGRITVWHKLLSETVAGVFEEELRLPELVPDASIINDPLDLDYSLISNSAFTINDSLSIYRSRIIIITLTISLSKPLIAWF